MRIDHVGIAVADFEGALGLCRDLLGVEKVEVQDVPSQGMRIAHLELENASVEILGSTSDRSPIAGFLAKRGSGIHHICFQVDDVRQALAQARAMGICLIDEEPRPGSRGTLIAFLSPKDTHGALVEFCQPSDQSR